MLPKRFTWGNVFGFGLLLDRTKIGPIPFVAVRWVVTVGWLSILGLFAAQQSWKPLGIAFAVGLLVCLGLFAHVLVLFKYQKERQLALYDEFDVIAGLPSLPYNKDNIARKQLRKSTPIRWNGKVLESATVRGQGGKVDDRHALRIVEYISHMGESDPAYTYIIPDLAAVATGTVQVVRVPVESDEAFHYKTVMKLSQILSNAAYLHSKVGFFSVEFEGLKRIGSPPFQKAELRGLAERKFDAHAKRGLLEAINAAFPSRDGYSWTVTPVGSDRLVFEYAQLSYAELNSEKDREVLANMVEAIKKRVSDRLGVFSYEIDGLNYDGDRLVGFDMVFKRQFFGEFLDPNVSRNFTNAYSKLLAQRFGDGWAATDFLLEESRISFSIR